MIVIYLIITILSITTVIFLLLYIKWRVSYRRLFEKSIKTPSEAVELVQIVDYSTISTEAETEENLKNLLRTEMEDHRVYLQKDLTVVQLAKQMGTNRATLSHFINNKMQKNFPQFINEYRVKEAVHLLSDPATSNYKIEVIGDMCGYKNRQVFHSSFKKVMGVTPMQFREMKENNIL